MGRTMRQYSVPRSGSWFAPKHSNMSIGNYTIRWRSVAIELIASRPNIQITPGKLHGRGVRAQIDEILCVDTHSPVKTHLTLLQRNLVPGSRYQDQ